MVEIKHVDVAYAERMQELKKEFQQILAAERQHLAIAKRLIKFLRKNVGKKIKDLKKSIKEEFSEYTVKLEPTGFDYLELSIYNDQLGSERPFKKNFEADVPIKKDLSAPFGVPDLEFMARKISEIEAIDFDSLIYKHEDLYYMIRQVCDATCNSTFSGKIKDAL